MQRSKPFAIATEGATTDGREISREWITQMADTYQPSTYTALGNLEHYLSMQPDSQFSAYGHVIELGTRETEILGAKKLQLTAIFAANDGIVALQKSGKKMFASIEVNPNFAKTGKAYLQGLAFTDSPASLGTEIMTFAANAQANPFAARKKDAANLFTVAEEVTLEWETENSPGDTLFSKVKTLLGLGKKDTDTRFADHSNAIEAIADSQKGLLENFASLDQQIADLITGNKTNSEAIAASNQAFADLKTQLAITDANPDTQRPPATGGDGQITTDC